MKVLLIHTSPFPPPAPTPLTVILVSIYLLSLLAGYSGTVFQLSPLLKLLPHSLSGTSLLLHCAWQAAYTWKENPHKVSGLGEEEGTSCVSTLCSDSYYVGVAVGRWEGGGGGTWLGKRQS